MSPRVGLDNRARLRIRLFGELDISVGDERVPPIESARAQSLLANLVLHDGAPQSRQRLAFVLWPDSTEGQARTNLRHLLHTLRTTCPALEAYLDVTPQTLRWSGRDSCWTDVAAFEAALNQADGVEPASDTELASLRDAVDLYGGDLLDGCYEEWLIEERARLHDRYTWALRRVIGLVSARGEPGEAIRLGRELLRLDPLREDTYRLLMRLHDAIGDRAGAVRTYHACESTLRRELGVEPSQATTQAYAALMRPGRVVAAAPERKPAVVSGAALVGRDDEWRRLTDLWRDAATGRGQLVLVSGEAGIGKTRLAEDLAAWCGHHGAAVAQGRSYPNEGGLGYGVVLAWLRSPDLAAHLRRMSDRDRALLARLLPELGSAEPAAADPAEQRLRLFEAVSRAVVAPGRATLLLADDVQWCDEQSLQLIHYLLRVEPRPAVLVVGTVRREDLDHAHPLTALVAGLGALDRVSEISLPRLARSETETLARLLAGPARQLEAGAVETLYAETEGNPLFIVETLRAGWGSRSSEISPRLQAVVTARIGQVSDAARDVLGLAATVGREFTAGVLAAASGTDDVTLVRALDELWRRGIVREQGTDAYDFSHGRIREVAYEALGPAARRDNHRRIAEALLRLRRDDVDLVSGEIARHYDRSGALDDAVAWYRRAAVQAQRLHASVEAVRLLARAADLVSAMPEGAGRRAHELAVLSALPTPLAVIDGFASPRLADIQGRVLELAGESGVDPDPALLRSLVMSALCRYDFDGARDLARRLRESAGAAGDRSLLVETEYLLGIAAFWSGALADARSHFEQVRSTFDAADRADHILRFGHDPSVVCRSRLANTLWFLGDLDGARATRDAAVAMADDVGHAHSRDIAHVFAAVLAVDLGEPAIVKQHVAAFTGEGRHQAVNVAMAAFQGYVDVLDGHVDEGTRRIREVVDTRPVDHAPGQRAVHLRLLVAAHAVAGDAEGGLRAADEALAAPGTRLWDAEHRRLRADFLALLGQRR